MSKNDVVTLDSRRFLGIINDSAQSKVALFEDCVREMGQKAHKNWQLVALRANELYFEDVDANQYYVADHSKDGRKININNIRSVNIVEAEKQGLFVESCLRLVNSIEENDQRGMQAAFNRMRSQRFSGRAVPYSGIVRCKDNVRRRITLSNGSSFTEDVRDRLIATIVEGLRNNVIVENGHVVSGTFNDGAQIKLPVTKWASRKLVARHIREAAENAYWSQGFQKRIKYVASLVAEGKIDEAVHSITEFLDEMEEFTLLTRKQTQTLIENTLAVNAIFNQQLCDDTATLFHRTNMQINKSKIVEEWRKIARVAEHPVLAENVQILSESNNFEAAYDKFLKLVFEAISNREVAAEALATTLEVLKNKTPKIRESHDLSSKLDNLIARLKNPQFDDAAIYEAEDLIATIQEELAATETLGNFDQIPSPSSAGGPGGDATGAIADLGAGAGSGAPVININSPLIQIGGTSSGGAGGGSEPEMPLGGEEDLGGGEEGGDAELEALLGGGGAGGAAGGGAAGGGAAGGGAAGGGAAGGGAGGGGLPFESKRNGRAVTESRPLHYEMKGKSDDDAAHECECEEEKDIDESADPYAIRSRELRLAENTNFSDYGAPVITSDGELRRIVRIMHKLAVEHKLTGKKLTENLGAMAKVSIQAVGLRLPEAKMARAIEQVSALFEAEGPFPGAAPLFGSDKDEVSDSDDSEDSSDTDTDDSDDSGSESSGKPWEDEGVAEDQYKTPKIKKRGLRRSSIHVAEHRSAPGKIQWEETQPDAKLGSYAGVKFIFDHGGENAELTPIILSEDGSVEIPIPAHLYNSAFAAAEMLDDDDAPFIKWLHESIEQLRPITDAEDTALSEAMARITTGPDGAMSVEVTDDVDVDNLGMGGEAEEAEEEAEEGELGGAGEEDMGMAPVDTVDTTPGGPPEDEDAMPDFEGGESLGGEGEMGGEEEMGGEPGMPGEMIAGGAEEEEEERLPFEDNDITDPKSTKYTKHVKDNKRDMPDPKLPKPSSDKLSDIGPELKKDNGSGTKPPTAKKNGN